MSLANQFPAQFQQNPKLSAITIAYENPAGIADAVLPRFPVDTPSFQYSIFNKTDMFTVPETKVGRTSLTNQVEWASSTGSATVEDHALEEVVPRRDQQLAASLPNVVDPKARATTQINTLLELGREQRAAALVFGPNSYAAANKTTLSGTSQWSDFTNSDPLAAILNVMDTMLVRPNQLVLGQLVATKLRTHPKVIQAYNGDNGQYGLAPLSFLAQLIGIDEVLVGQQWVNTSAKGQNANLTRMWGKSAALLYTNKLNLDGNTPSFGATAQWGGRITGEYFDENKGMRGSDVVRVGESVKEIVLASDMGYLFQNAIA